MGKKQEAGSGKQEEEASSEEREARIGDLSYPQIQCPGQRVETKRFGAPESHS